MDSDIYIKAYERMLTIRFFEEKAEEIFGSGKINGTVHTCIGQEACAVGVCFALRKDDIVTSTHRGHGHFIAKGGDISKISAELTGNVNGYSHGKGGSQLMSDFSIGFMGSNGIVGGFIPLATGMAFHIKQKGEKRIVACFLGDGAVNQGTFHESLNMAGLWKLPIMYICENNLYGMSTKITESMANPDIAAKAKMYAMRGIAINGNDFDTVYKTIKNEACYIRQGAGALLIELKTYRLSGHSRGDRRVYRTRKEEEIWEMNDPLLKMKNFLLDKKLTTSGNERNIVLAVRENINNVWKNFLS